MTPGNTLRSSLGGSTGKGSQLGPLRGSVGEHGNIQNTATGPRLSNEGPMRTSAENYLMRGSADVRYTCVFYVIYSWNVHSLFQYIENHFIVINVMKYSCFNFQS